MSCFTDREYLTTKQYRDDTNLNARIALHRRFSTNPYPWFRWVFDQFDIAAPAQILELGCGPGDLWLENRDRIAPDWHVVLTDLSPGMLHRARTRLRDIPHPFSFRRCDAQSLPFPSGSFDAVIANHMLYHVPDRSRAFAEITRVLKADGCLYAALNGENHLQELAALIRRAAPDLPIPVNAVQASGMTLEGAQDEFRHRFRQVTLREYLPNALRVTEVEPLIAYIRSMVAAPFLTATHLDALRTLIAHEIAAHGAFHITKSTGLYIACRPVSPSA